MKLSKRLFALAAMIPEDKNIIDIGCDHGLLDIYLAQRNKNIHVLATDISEESIESAKETAKKYEIKNLEFKVLDGLTGLSIQDEVIVMAGMGAFTMLSILEKGSLQNNSLVLSAHKNVDFLRRKMVEKEYYIREEKAIFDRKWYILLFFEKGEKIYNEEDYLVGPYTKKNRDYIKYLYDKEEKIVQKKGEKTPLFTILEKLKRQ